MDPPSEGSFDRFRSKVEARQARLAERKEQREARRDDKEAAAAFESDFKAKRSDVEHGFEKAKSLPLDDRDLLFDRLQLQVKEMGELLASKAYILPNYEVRTCQELVSNLEREVQAKRRELVPRKKFSFSRRSRKSEKTDQESAEEPERKEKTSENPAMSADAKDNWTISGRKDEKIVLKEESIRDQDLTLSELENCEVFILGILPAFRVRKLKNCKICSGPVKSSVFFEDCENVTLMSFARQFRIHDSVQCDFYVFSVSGPIIERCKQLRFAPNVFEYEGLENHFQSMDYAKEDNLWNKVEDFNWLRAQQSPNWSIIPEKERIEVHSS